jgi:signal transduction histidine kinase
MRPVAALRSTLIHGPALARLSRRGRLFRKYVLIFVVLVSGGLITSGLVELYFAFQAERTALTRLQQEMATNAASEIAHFVNDMTNQLEWSMQPLSATDPLSNAERRTEYLRLLRRAPAITDVHYIDPAGRERLHVSRVSITVEDQLLDVSREPAFVQPTRRMPYFGPVYFRSESEPYMQIALREADTGGVIAAEVNLKFIWDVVSEIKVGQAGYAYVVDGQGILVAHPDISRVLKKTDLSSTPQFAAVGSGPGPLRAAQPVLEVPSTVGGGAVLTAHQLIDPPGWWVFVDQPLEEAFAPLYSSIVRTLLLLLGGVAISIGASLLLARRMVTPIHALQAGAALIGAGALDQRIEVETGDELEELANEFNQMAEQLRRSYAELEQKVNERTSELATAFQDIAATSRQLQIANQHKSEFLANMSHELRTPLNAIIGFAEMLSEGMLGELAERQRDYVLDILASGRHLLALINDILDLSKVEAGRMELELNEFSVAEVLDYAVNIVRAWCIRQGLVLRLEVAPDIESMHADERKIKQVLFNLLSNALRFTPRGGSIDVTARRGANPTEIVISVRDTGVGIPHEQQARIFDEFYQAAGGPGRSRDGTGLGLALAKKFVELHGGRLWVDSQPGAGSTFSFTLPLELDKRAVTRDTSAVAPGIVLA